MNRCLLLLLTTCLVLLGYQPARASHAQGGQLTYEALGNNRYRVTCRYFRDCSGIAAETSLTLNARVGSPTTSCNSNDPRNFQTTLVRGVPSIGSPYCANVPGANVCTTTSQYANYEVANYTADVTLPAAPEWTLSVEISARPSLRNISGNTTLRFEATLNNQITLNNGTQQNIQNTSPQYVNQDSPVPFVCVRQRSTLTFSTFEPDGDSLVYSLEAPLEGCNVVSTYGNTPAGSPIVISLNPPCVFNPPGQPTPFSPTYPIPSYNLTGSCGSTGGVINGTPYFNFNAQMGSFTFTPALFANTQPAAGDNKYAVVGKVTEYRLLNGRYYKIGSVRRDMLVVVIDCGTNAAPSTPTNGGGPITQYDSVVVEGPVGAYTLQDIRLNDPNPNDLLTVSLATPPSPDYPNMHVDPVNPAPPVVVIGNGTATPTLRVRLRPEPSLLGRTFRVPVRVEDNACPVKGVQYYILVLKATPNRPTAAQPGRGRTVLGAYPTPFAQQVTFTLPRPRPGATAVLIFDQLGRVVERLPVPAAAAAEATLTWTPAATVPAGVYSARFADGRHTARLVRVAP